MASLTSTRFTKSLANLNEGKNDHAATPGANYYEGCLCTFTAGSSGPVVDAVAGAVAAGVVDKTILNAKAGQRVVVRHGAFDLDITGNGSGDLTVVDNHTLATGGDGTGGKVHRQDADGKRWAEINPNTTR